MRVDKKCEQRKRLERGARRERESREGVRVEECE